MKLFSNWTKFKEETTKVLGAELCDVLELGHFIK